jgi:hypothetical protein
MRKTALRVAGLLLVLAAVASSTPRAQAQQACTLLCIQGYHCCTHGGNQSCVPESQPCH